MLATLAELKTYLWISWTDQDSILNIFLSWADSFIKTYTSRKLEADDYEEIFDWDGQKYLMLNEYPVNTIDGLYINIWSGENYVWEEINNEQYRFDMSIWKLSYIYWFQRGIQNYKVVYNAWYSIIPWDLKLAT